MIDSTDIQPAGVDRFPMSAEIEAVGVHELAGMLAAI